MEKEQTKLIGEHAAFLSLIETGLGSLLHGLRIPLSGQFLSLNQIAFMARISSKSKSKEAPLQISVISSLLKSLSPAGKKLTPMLAILAQGFFFSAGLTLFGMNIFGFIIASLLSAVWAFVQPVLIIYLIFGKDFLNVVEYFNKEISKVIHFELKWLLPLFVGFVLIKLIAGVAVCFVAIRAKEEQFDRWQSKLIHEIKPKEQKNVSSPLVMALKDLMTPLFLISLGLTAAFFIFSESTHVQLIWGLLRPIAVGFILFYLVRVYPVENFANVFEKLGWKDFARHFKAAILTIKSQREKR